MPRHDSRRFCWSIGATLVLCAIGPLLSARVDAASPASAGEGALSAVPGKSVKMVQVSADLSLDLDRLGKRGAGSEVFDLFPPAAGSSSPSKGKAGGKRAAPAQPVKGEADETFVNPIDTVVSLPAPELRLPVPAAAPVVSAPLPPPPVAPPVIAAPPPPPAPKPPAVPFAYIGKLEEGTRTVYFLVKGDKLFMVKAGDDIDEVYSFDGEADNQLRLTYKPLRVAQTLTVGP